MWAVVTWLYFVLAFESRVFVGHWMVVRVILGVLCSMMLRCQAFVKRIDGGNEKLRRHVGY